MKKRPQRQRRKSQEPPKTIGDLRKLLAALGDPWTPDPTLSDDDPIPMFPTGGDGSFEPVGKVLPKRGAGAIPRTLSPTNPFLRELWEQRGLIERTPRTKKPSAKRRRPPGTG